MTKDCILQSWTRASRLGRFEIESGSIQWVQNGLADDEARGFAISTIAGRIVAVYRDSENWVLQCGSRKWLVNERGTRVEVTRFGPLLRITVADLESVSSWWFLSLWTPIIKRLDPTFDSLDGESSDIGEWLISLSAE